jgi:hypothetical protein
MTAQLPRQLKELATTIGALPDDARADVLAEIEAKVKSLKQSQLTDAQTAIVRQRLAEPRVYASAAEVTDLLRRYNPSR